MLVSAIQKYQRGRVPTVFYGREDAPPQENPLREPVIAQSRHNRTAISGGLALAFLGTTAVTGIAHAKIPHMVSSLLTIAAALFHMESIAPHKNLAGRHEYMG